VNTLRFPQAAARLTQHGYRPVPITPGTKAPTRLPKWQHYVYTPTDDARFADCGVGILTGDVLGVDIDIPDASVVKELTMWLVNTYGAAPVRVGNKPKLLLLYRAALPGQRKAQTPVYERGGLRGKVEVLATGQQFVAFHIHPGTQQPYEWWGADPLSIPASRLRALTGEQVSEIIRHCDLRLARWGTSSAPTRGCGRPLGAAFRRPGPGFKGALADNEALKTKKTPVSMAQLARALADYSDFDASDYDSWLEAGAVIHHETGGTDAGLDLFIKYSRCLTGFYSGAEAGEEGCRAKWRSFGQSCASPVTFGTLVHRLAVLETTRRQEQPHQSAGRA